MPNQPDNQALVHSFYESLSDAFRRKDIADIKGHLATGFTVNDHTGKAGSAEDYLRTLEREFSNTSPRDAQFHVGKVTTSGQNVRAAVTKRFTGKQFSKQSDGTKEDGHYDSEVVSNDTLAVTKQGLKLKSIDTLKRSKLYNGRPVIIETPRNATGMLQGCGDEVRAD